MAKEPKKNVGTPEKTKPATIAKPAVPAKARAARPAKAAAPAAQAAATPAAPKKAAPRKAPVKGAAGSAAKPRQKAAVPADAVSPEQRYRMIQDAAYFIAERNGFVGDNHAYWLEAEQAIDAELAGR
jgi:hypothetical protein